MEAQYQYEALDLSQPSLRLLQVKPGRDEDEIECILRNETVRISNLYCPVIHVAS